MCERPTNSGSTSRFPFVRFSIRTLLVLVFVVALCCGLWIRNQKLEARAQFHERMSTGWTQLLDEGTGAFGIAVVKERLMREWHHAMCIKLRRSKWRPWIHFQPDPPQPQQPPQIPAPNFRPLPRGADGISVAQIVDARPQIPYK